MNARAKRMMQAAVNSVTFRQYSVLQGLTFLFLGIYDFAAHFVWWLQLLIAVGVIVLSGILNELIRVVTGLPRDRAR